jgi:hypothetical protein
MQRSTFEKDKKMRSIIIYILFCFIFTVSSFCQNIQYEHFICDNLFDYYENDTIVQEKKIVLRIDAKKYEDNSTYIECTIANILLNVSGKAFKLELHQYRNTDGYIRNIEFNRSGLSFDLYLGIFNLNRPIRLSCEILKNGYEYKINGVGLWKNINNDGYTKIEWKQVKELIIPYDKLLRGCF